VTQLPTLKIENEKKGITTGPRACTTMLHHNAANRTPIVRTRINARASLAEAQERRPAHRRRRGHRHVLQRLLVQRRARIALAGFAVLGRRGRRQLRLQRRGRRRRRRRPIVLAQAIELVLLIGDYSVASRALALQQVVHLVKQPHDRERGFLRRIRVLCDAVGQLQGRERARPRIWLCRRRRGRTRISRATLEARLSSQGRQHGRRRGGRRHPFHIFFFYFGRFFIVFDPRTQEKKNHEIIE